MCEYKIQNERASFYFYIYVFTCMYVRVHVYIHTAIIYSPFLQRQEVLKQKNYFKFVSSFIKVYLTYSTT